MKTINAQTKEKCIHFVQATKLRQFNFGDTCPY